MRKEEKAILTKEIKRLSLPQCPEHKLPLVEHAIDEPRILHILHGEREKCATLCWDCPGKMTKAQQEVMRRAYPNEHFDDNSPCFYHVHQEEK